MERVFARGIEKISNEVKKNIEGSTNIEFTFLCCKLKT